MYINYLLFDRESKLQSFIKRNQQLSLERVYSQRVIKDKRY